MGEAVGSVEGEGREEGVVEAEGVPLPQALAVGVEALEMEAEVLAEEVALPPGGLGLPLAVELPEGVLMREAEVQADARADMELLPLALTPGEAEVRPEAEPLMEADTLALAVAARLPVPLMDTVELAV